MSLRALLERAVSPGLSTCGRCRRPWLHPAQRRIGPRSWAQLDRPRLLGVVGVESHATPYSDSRGLFPLCEGCWQALAPAGRLPYYRALWDEWAPLGRDGASWSDVERAVMAGL